MEFWTVGRLVPRLIARQAEHAEATGWDGLLMGDSQNMVGEAYVMLGTAAAATSSLRLGTGVTNPVTRHPAVTASAAATLQAVSGGRATLGIGRGDSALAHLGLAPSPVPVFERYLHAVQTYLRGDAVGFDELDTHGHRTFDHLGLAAEHPDSRMPWVTAMPKVPVDVVGSGRRVIELGATVADRVSFTLGAQPERVAWGIDVARAARRAAGLPEHMSFGAYLNVVAHPDRAVARRLAAVGAAAFARFSAMHGSVNGPVDDGARDTLQKVAQTYDVRQHGSNEAEHGSAMGAEFLDSFAVVGTPQECADRLSVLGKLGLDRVVILAALAEDGDDLDLSRRLLVDEVFPAVRATVTGER